MSLPLLHCKYLHTVKFNTHRLQSEIERDGPKNVQTQIYYDFLDVITCSLSN